MTLKNGKTKGIPYPQPGFNCNADYGLAQKAPSNLYVPFVYPGLPGFDVNKLEHCPDFNERMNLKNGKTKGIPYPQAGFNCNADYGLMQKEGGPLYVPYSYPGLPGFDIKKLEHCPDFNERMTLANGKTKGIPYPKPGFNCNADYGLVQGAPS